MAKVTVEKLAAAVAVVSAAYPEAVARADRPGLLDFWPVGGLGPMPVAVVDLSDGSVVLARRNNGYERTYPALEVDLGV